MDSLECCPLARTMHASATLLAVLCWAVKRAVSFKTGINGGVHGDEAESVPQKKAHSSIVIDRNATMSGYCKRSAKDTITIKVGPWDLPCLRT